MNKKEEILADVNKALETTPKKQITALTTFKGFTGKEITSFFTHYKERLSQLTKQSPDKIVETAVQMILTNPSLVDCTAPSITGALMQSAILDLEATPQLGNCYFVPYNKKVTGPDGKEYWIKEVQFQIGYRGWLTLVRRSSQIKWIDAFAVSKDEFTSGKFKVTYGAKPNIEHECMVEVDIKPDGSNLAFVYAVCELMNGAILFKILSSEQVENYRKRSPSQKKKNKDEYVYPLSGAWATDYPAMAKGKAIKQLCKFLPLEQEIQEAIASDEAVINEEAVKDGKVNLVEVVYPDEHSVKPEEVKVEEPIPLSWKFIKGTKKFSQCIQSLKDKGITGYVVDEDKWTITLTEELISNPVVIDIYLERMNDGNNL